MRRPVGEAEAPDPPGREGEVPDRPGREAETRHHPGREATGGWLQMAGAALLLGSLFLTWSHQYPATVLSTPGMAAALAAVPRDATGWEVYSVADVLLALLAVALGLTALGQWPRARGVVAGLVGLALGFVVHALAAPPTSGVEVIAQGGGRYLARSAGAGVGETVALAGLGLALGGFLVAAYPRSPDVHSPSREAPRATG